MPTAAPLSVAPVSVALLTVPTFALLKAAVPPIRLTSSAPITPESVRVCTVAAVLPSYTLFATVKLPVIPNAVMLLTTLPLVLL